MYRAIDLLEVWFIEPLFFLAFQQCNDEHESKREGERAKKKEKTGGVDDIINEKKD